MLVIRPIKSSDLNGLLELLQHSGHGLTSLPQDPEILQRRIELSERSFEAKNKWGPNGELYLFVMEDIFKGTIVGISGIISKIGGFDPYYFYQIKDERHSSEMLQVKTCFKSLHIHKVYSGPAEICSLFLSPEYRNSQNGRLLSLSRFLYIAQNRTYFEKEIIAEMRGRVDDSGHSPFWDAVGAKFFKMPFPEADFLTMKSKKFIEELLPSYPIIADLLPKEAQEVIAQVHQNTEPAKRILEQEGFYQSDLVGIFEPGPVMKAEVDNIRSVKGSEIATIGAIEKNLEDGEQLILARILEDKPFMACVGTVKELENYSIAISATVATTLKVKIGDKLRYIGLKG